MKSLRYGVLAPVGAGVLLSATLYIGMSKAKAADAAEAPPLPQHAECAFFGPLRDHYMQEILRKARRSESAAGALTRQVTAKLAKPDFMPGGSHGHDGAVSTTGPRAKARMPKPISHRP